MSVDRASAVCARLSFARKIAFCCLVLVGLSGCHHNPPRTAGPATAPSAVSLCPASIDPRAEQPLSPVTLPVQPGSCTSLLRNGLPLPDPSCTPGAINPTLTLAVLEQSTFRTSCLRNKATSAREKDQTFAWYGIRKPVDNVGRDETCEKDHLVPLYLGGSDTLANIWPQCGPDDVTLRHRDFKKKDQVEFYLGRMVRGGQMPLAEAQQGIARDWTQYLDAAQAYCRANGCGFAGSAVD